MNTISDFGLINNSPICKWKFEIKLLHKNFLFMKKGVQTLLSLTPFSKNTALIIKTKS